MLQAFALTFREGLGAFVVVAVALAFFHRTGHHRLIVAARWGIAASVLASMIAGLLFSGAENQALWEGVLALLAAPCVARLAVYMWRTARAKGPQRPGRVATVATFLVTVLMIARGGMEISLLLGTMLLQVRASDPIVGAVLGTLLAIAVAWVWSRVGRRVPRTLFQHVTAIFLVLFFVGLLIDGVNEVAEANVFPGAERLHAATQAYSGDGVYGQYAPYVLVGAPLVWFLLAIFLGYGKASHGRVAHVGR